MEKQNAFKAMLAYAMYAAKTGLSFGKRKYDLPTWKYHKAKATARRRRANKITREIKQRIRRRSK